MVVLNDYLKCYHQLLWNKRCSKVSPWSCSCSGYPCGWGLLGCTLPNVQKDTKIVARPPTVLLANNAPMSSSTFDGANPGVGVGWVRLHWCQETKNNYIETQNSCKWPLQVFSLVFPPNLSSFPTMTDLCQDMNSTLANNDFKFWPKCSK